MRSLREQEAEAAFPAVTALFHNKRESVRIRPESPILTSEEAVFSG
ncbi:hypothetical protein AOE01nite_31690 [Acetobacter oeni]|uniref:Uncharacterized protein n=1 Tax=Acetobacter oeni TaxID=304077 RepID=A0A511XPR6_9PROT|nr:hypothetical protein AOE01nite_31690 [Acetobacter oeni]